MATPDPEPALSSEPALSIVIAARDAAAFIDATLASIAAQTRADWETIVVDDGSTDATPSIVARRVTRDGRIRCVLGPKAGVSTARNAGLAEARAPAALFLDADDLLAPDAVACFLDTLASTDAVAAMAGVRRISEGGDPLPGSDNRALAPASGTLPALIGKNFVVNGGALAIRTAAARRAGAYDPDLAFGEDWEFWCRLAELGDFAIVPGEPLLLYRQRAAGANHRAAGPPLARRVPCLEKVAGNAAIRSRLGRRLPRLLRARRIDIFWAGVRNEHQFGARAKAFALAAAGLAVYPDSLLRPRLVLRLLRSIRA